MPEKRMINLHGRRTGEADKCEWETEGHVRDGCLVHDRDGAALTNLELDAHRRERREDVREQDHAVSPVGVPLLTRTVLRRSSRGFPSARATVRK